MQWQAHDRGWRKVTVVGFDEEGTMQVVPVDRTCGPGRQFITVGQIRLRQRSFANSPH